MALASSPIVAGGVVAQLAVAGIMQQKGLLEVEIFCLLVLVLQSLAGIPVASVILKKEARRFIESGDIKNYLNQTNSEVLKKEEKRMYIHRAVKQVKDLIELLLFMEIR